VLLYTLVIQAHTDRLEGGRGGGREGGMEGRERRGKERREQEREQRNGGRRGRGVNKRRVCVCVWREREREGGREWKKRAQFAMRSLHGEQ
jgi:hypothetical protein